MSGHAYAKILIKPFKKFLILPNFLSSKPKNVSENYWTRWCQTWPYFFFLSGSHSAKKCTNSLSVVSNNRQGALLRLIVECRDAPYRLFPYYPYFLALPSLPILHVFKLSMECAHHNNIIVEVLIFGTG